MKKYIIRFRYSGTNDLKRVSEALIKLVNNYNIIDAPQPAYLIARRAVESEGDRFYKIKKSASAFFELAELTTLQASAIKRLLGTAVRRGSILSDWYVGPEQKTPSAFEEVYARIKEATNIDGAL